MAKHMKHIVAKKTGNTPKLQSPDEWINKIWYIHTTDITI